MHLDEVFTSLGETLAQEILKNYISIWSGLPELCFLPCTCPPETLLSYALHAPAWAAMTKRHRLSGLSKGHFFSHRSEVQSPRAGCQRVAFF